jgi:hypothetical protein
MNWWHPPALVLSLFPNLDPQKEGMKEQRGGGSFFQRVAWIILPLVVPPFAQVESRLGRGAIATFYAVKLTFPLEKMIHP